MSAIRYQFTDEDMETKTDGEWVRYFDYRLLEAALEKIIDADSSAAQVIAKRALGRYI